jgi:3-methyladenine DNA glycosylase AlkD
MTIFETFRAHADSEKAAQMSAYMRYQFSFCGIPTPERKKLGRPFLKVIAAVDWNFIFSLWEQPEREFQYFACGVLEKCKATLIPADIPNLRRLAVTKSWWDTIDILDGIVGDIASQYREVNETLMAWSVDENFWLRRIAIDHQLARKDKTDTALLEQIIVNNLGQSEFFINKAIGWSLREYSKTNPGWVRSFIERHRDGLSPLSVREGSKYL